MAGQIGDPGLYPCGGVTLGVADKNFWELNPPASQTGKIVSGVAQTWTTDGSTEIVHMKNNAGVAEFGIYGSPFDYLSVHAPTLNYALVWDGTAFAATNIGGPGPFVQLAPASRQTGAAISLQGNLIDHIVDIAAIGVSPSVFIIDHIGNTTIIPPATAQIGLSISSTTLTTGVLVEISAPTGTTALSFNGGIIDSGNAQTWKFAGNTASAFELVDNVPNAYYTLNTLTGTDNINAHTFVPGTPPSYGQSATSSYSSVGLSAYTWTGTAASTTVTALNGLQLNIAAPTIAFSSANTVTTASTIYIGGAPAAGTNATITNPFGLYIDKGAAMGLAGSTSGFIGMKAAAATTSYSVIWPAAQASGTQVLQNDGSGNLSWATISTSASWSGLTNPTAALALTMAAADTTTFTLQQTTQTGFTWTSSTLTSGSLAAFTSTSTALAAGNALVSINSSGANATSGITATGLSVSVTNTGTSGTNIGLNLSVSGATTNNYALYISNGLAFFNGGFTVAAGVATFETVPQMIIGGFNTDIGFGTGALASDEGNNNLTAVGYFALNSDTNGRGNTAFGYSAAANAGTNGGGDNTAVGVNAMLNTGKSLSGAASNTALGSTTLYSNTAGSNNTVAGFQAGYSYTTSYLCAFGANSCYNATTAANTSAFGYQTLFSLTTGNNNSALGYEALYNTTTGGNNCAFGYETLLANTTASWNVAFGGQALTANTTGTQNTAIGSSSLYNYNNTVSAAGNMTALGYQSGLNYTGAELNNIVIGYNLGVAGESNMLRIGNPALGAGYGQIAFSTKGLVGLGVGPIYGAGLLVSLGTTATTVTSYTPTSASGQFFVVKWSLACVTASTPTLTLSWTDPKAGAQSVTLFNSAMTANTTAQGVYVIAATSAAAITLSGSDSLAAGDIFASGTIVQEQ